jgi:hypothetical protein
MKEEGRTKHRMAKLEAGMFKLGSSSPESQADKQRIRIAFLQSILMDLSLNLRTNYICVKVRQTKKHFVL